eukprot:1149254-Pelagomonas_calceolata.AAC.13
MHYALCSACCVQRQFMERELPPCARQNGGLGSEICTKPLASWPEVNAPYTVANLLRVKAACKLKCKCECNGQGKL